MSEQTKVVRTITGHVVSDSMNKTIRVEIVRKVRHPKYGKYVKRITKLFAHDEANQCKKGDQVVIKSTRPISKKKSWTLVEVVEAAS